MKKVYFITTLIFLFGFACKNQKINSSEDSYANTFQELRDFIEKPESLLTQEQKVKREILYELVLKKIIVKDNQFNSMAEVKDFTSRGLSKYYYDILEKSLKETNQWVKEENITNLDSMFQSSGNIFLRKE